MKPILIFAGTSEGRRLTQYLAERNVQLYVCVATDYGDEMIEKKYGTEVRTGRLTSQEMLALMHSHAFELVIDATHPYADAVSTNISNACSAANIDYLRVVREDTETTDCVSVRSAAEAVAFLNNTAGTILLTTGSKDLHTFAALDDFAQRVHPRVLPSQESLNRCLELGYRAQNIICMQGPFSTGMNIAMLKQIGATYLVTKESGSAGGFDEKIQAAAVTGATAIVIGRPIHEQGMSEKQTVEYLNKRFHFSQPHKNTLKSRLKFPLFVDLNDAEILIVGGGTIASRRAKALSEFGARIHVIATEISSELRSFAHNNRVEITVKTFEEKDIAHPRIVIAATDDRDINRSIYEYCIKRGILCNVADKKDECDFYFPSLIRTDNLVIGIAGDGSDHKRTKNTADRIRACLQEETEE